MREKSNAELVGLILDEIDRFSKMSSEERRAISKAPDWPLIYGLPNKYGVELTCGKEAHAALSELSRRARQGDSLILDRCSGNAAFQVFRRHFLKHLLKMAVDGQIDEDAFIERYSKAIRRLITWNLREHKFGVPCVLPIGSEIKKMYALGPVQFVRSDHWIKTYPVDFPSARPLDEYSKRDLSSFPWIAFASIKKTEPERGQRMAEIAVDAAINIIRVFLVMAGQWPEVYRLGHGGGRLPPKITCGISFVDEIPQSWYTRQSHPYVGDDFIEFLEGEDAYIQMLGGALKSTTDGVPVTPAISRFMDALKWFGEACMEGRSGAQIVKAVMCLERLVVFDCDDGGLKERVSKRGAALLAMFWGGEYHETKKALAMAYKARSNLMHGVAGPWEQTFDIAPYDVLKLAARALFSFAGLVASTPLEMRSDIHFRSAIQRLVQGFEFQQP